MWWVWWPLPHWTGDVKSRESPNPQRAQTTRNSSEGALSYVVALNWRERQKDENWISFALNCSSALEITPGRKRWDGPVGAVLPLQPHFILDSQLWEGPLCPRNPRYSNIAYSSHDTVYNMWSTSELHTIELTIMKINPEKWLGRIANVNLVRIDL